MDFTNRLKDMSPAMLILFIISKCVIWFGVGIVLGNLMLKTGTGWWIALFGVVLSLPGWFFVLKK